MSLPLLVVSLSTLAPLLRPVPAAALNSSSWSPGHIIDDVVFTNNASMTVQQIQNFLVAKVPTCDTNGTQPTTHPNGSGGYYTRAQWSAFSGNNAPWACLRDYYENTSTLQNNFHDPSTPIPGAISSAQIIWNAGQEFHINPQVILATLQKEQGLVTDDWPWYSQYKAAMGYGCPDTAACDSKYYGFYNQVESAAWQFRYYLDHPNAYNYWTGNNYIQYNPDSNCGGSNVYIQNAATAALYIYTPYQPNGSALNGLSDSSPGGTGTCGAYGNRNFWWYFNTWFGSSLAQPNDYSFVTSAATATHYNPGGTGSVSITLKNTGLNTWYSDNNLPSGKKSTRLATIGYQDSPFFNPDHNSLNSRNQVLMTPDVVAPGENATFTYDVLSPYKTFSSHAHFEPIVDGVFLKDVGMDVVLYSDTPSWNPTTYQADTTTLLPNQITHSHFVVQNTSGSTWYSDSNTPNGYQPTRMATFDYKDSLFADTSDPAWLGTRNQIRMNEASVPPGSNATFDATFIGPIRSVATKDAFHFHIIVGGVFTDDKGLVFNFSAPAAVLTLSVLGATNPPATMAVGQAQNVSITLQNTGNVVWQDESVDGGAHSLRLAMSHPLYRSTTFYDSSDNAWLANGQVRKSSGITQPGQSASFTYSWKASAIGTYKEPFQFAVSGWFYPDYGTNYVTTVQ
jgi:hypothetical protein